MNGRTLALASLAGLAVAGVAARTRLSSRDTDDTEDENKRRVAQGLPPDSVVHELPAGTRGLRIADYIREPDGEAEWIVQTPAGSLAITGRSG